MWSWFSLSSGECLHITFVVALNMPQCAYIGHTVLSEMSMSNYHNIRFKAEGGWSYWWALPCHNGFEGCRETGRMKVCSMALCLGRWKCE